MFKYRAFISYSHQDEKWAQRLHRALEAYRVPKHLVGMEVAMGRIPKRLSPVFRDRDELPTATNLSKVISQALRDSACQVVICSPNAARSRWVNQEILEYKRLGRHNRIFPIIVDGEPFAQEHGQPKGAECFPASLRFKLDENGELSDTPAESMAADLRPGKDGFANAKLKIISGILGVGFDDLRQREMHRRHRKMAIIAMAAVAGMFITSGLAAIAWFARVEAERQEARAEAEAESLRQTTAFLVDIFRVSDPSVSRGDEFTAHELLDRGAERIDTELVDQPVIQATLMDTLGTVYTGLGSVDRATPLLRRAVEQRRAIRGETHEEVAESLNHLGQVLKLKAEFEEAEAVLRNALAVRRELYGDSHPDVAQSINELADILSRNGDYASAEPLFREALRLRQQLHGTSHPDVAQTLEDLALNLFDQGDFESPVPLLRQAVDIRLETQGDPHPDVAEALNNLGFVIGELGEFEEAERLYRESLAMKRKLLPEVHAEIAMGLNNVAFVLHDRGEYEEAEALYREALEIQRQVFGDDHSDVAMSLTNLAYLLYDRGSIRGAAALASESLQIYERVLGANHPSATRSRNNLALWMVELGELETAETLLRQSLEIQKSTIGTEHPDYAGSLTLLANIFVATDRYEDARTFASRAKEINSASLTPGHWRTMIAVSAEGAALAGLGRYTEAEKLLLESNDALARDPSVLAVFVAENRKQLANLYLKLGENEKAISLRGGTIDNPPSGE